MSSYNFSSIFTRIRDIATFVLLHTTFPSSVLTGIAVASQVNKTWRVGSRTLTFSNRRLQISASKISINKNTFCGTRYLAHCCSLHGVVAVTWPRPRQRFGDFSQGSHRDYPWNMPVKFEVRTVLELLAFNAHKLTGVTWPWPRPHRKLLSRVMSALSLGTRLPNLKFVSLAILKL